MLYYFYVYNRLEFNIWGGKLGMKSIGIVRQIDELGRIVLPKELRTSMDLKEGNPMEIFVDEGKVILKRYNPFCVFCNEASDIEEFRGKNVCSKCRDELSE